MLSSVIVYILTLSRATHHFRGKTTYTYEYNRVVVVAAWLCEQ